MRDAAGFHHVPKQTEVRQIEALKASFAKNEARLIIMAIAYDNINANLSSNTKFGPSLICGLSFVSIAAGNRIG